MTIMFMIGPCLGATPRPPKGLIYFQLLSSIITNIFFQQNFFSKNATFHHVLFLLVFYGFSCQNSLVSKRTYFRVGEGSEYDSLSKKPYPILKCHISLYATKICDYAVCITVNFDIMNHYNSKTRGDYKITPSPFRSICS